MLRRKNDSMRDIPKDVRHSLEILDNLLDEFDVDDQKGRSPAPPLSQLGNVPVDVRRSLEFLDCVLGDYEVPEEGRGAALRRDFEDTKLREPDEVSDEVNKSLDLLDQVLDEFQIEGGHPTFGRKQQPRGASESLRRPKHEDVRRSLEVLDSVLAEFDDCLEAWDSLGQDTTTYDDCEREFKLKDSAVDILESEFSKTSLSFDNRSIDGDTSHDSGLSLHEQNKIASPPPVPKRSATTKLSDRGSGLFNFQLTDSRSFDSLHSEYSAADNDLSEINSLSAKDNDEVFQHDHNNYCCTKCGSEIESAVKVQGMAKKDVSSSPFSERRKIFETLQGESNVSPSLERTFNGSSFKVKQDSTNDYELEPSSLVFKSVDIDRVDSNQSSFASKYSPKATKVSPPRVDGLLSLPNSPYHAPNCNCKERIRRLQAKFSETLRLLKDNKIKSVNHKPPSFVPPPPPPEVVAKNFRNENPNTQLDNGLLKNAPNSRPRGSRTPNGSTNSISSEENSLSTSMSDSEKNSRNDNSPAKQKLCKRCSISTELLPLSETIEDLPKLLPTDALKRPYLGLSYSMEDDLCPGVKEILQTSAPSPRYGAPLSRNSKSNSLSTFSLSDSSLGYGSSQSDHEHCNSPMKPDKVPVSSIKFSTLPEGMDLHSLPSYYGQSVENGVVVKLDRPLYRDRNFNHTSDPQLRSSIAPLEPEPPEKPKKGGIFRGFSRKKKNGELVRGKNS